MRRFCLLLCCSVAIAVGAQEWKEDILGDKYQQMQVAFADDYSGKVKATVIRKLSDCSQSVAVLYVHGYNDYFYQKELGDNFAKNGYNFYAVDLRKYGRSIIEGQKMFEVRDLKEYFEDIEMALDVILQDGNKSIVLMGHSNGGLITSYYLAKARHERYPIKALILNSPFLDMNLNCLLEDFALPVVGACAWLMPDIALKQGGGNQYARTLLTKYGGEWDYDTNWKHEMPQDVTMGWLKAITMAQDELHRGASIDVPILLLRSDRSSAEDVLSDEESRNVDLVLDVEEISKYGKRLGTNVTEYVIKNGIHDLFLSRMPVRFSVYSHVFKWLREHEL